MALKSLIGETFSGQVTFKLNLFRGYTGYDLSLPANGKLSALECVFKNLTRICATFGISSPGKVLQKPTHVFIDNRHGHLL
ncbi:hypothetical protein E4L95_09875 [Paracoccus liaowanqingii]|uniref:Uncharacterized protein n=1 Tax=Paracoccus liaowanqingii TaxID=2560053 RepID=A0A4Z1C9M5_9RHOB|nr:hypothetical protein [Paracoccus liaowanqingii]TGN61597.1 hypothetical protein E4L95_09875 [Paracoccus liaowanqingii]